MLKVTVAEVQRSIVKQLGIDLSASLTYGTSVVKFNNNNPFTANSGPLVPGNALTTSFGSTPSVRRRCARWNAQVSCGRSPNPI